MYKDKTQLRKDGHRTLESGMNSGRDPVLLTATECAFASNVTFRNGFPSNRQKFTPLQLKDGGATGGAPGGLSSFQTANFQGAAVYDISDYEQHIMVMAGGTLFQLDINGGITVTGIYNDGKSIATASQCWFCQADIYFVIQDGKSIPIILQGLTTPPRRAGATEVPVGGPMAYGQGRLWLAQGRQVVAGDILGGPTSVISFTEQTYLAEAAFFGVPLSCGDIVGLIFIEQGDTQTGQGELLLFARKAAFSIQAGVPRAATQTQPGWAGTPGMQRVALVNTGGTGWRNLVNVNQDVFFRSKDGWRTFRTARNEAFGWGGAPISNEMLRVLYTDSLQLLDYASSAIFKNRVLLTCTPSPYPKNITGGGAVFHNLCVLDIQVVSSVINKSNLAYEFSPYFSQRGSPAYDGVWSPPNGLEILQIVQAEIAREERLFAFCYNPSTEQTEIWELIDYMAFDQQTLPVTSQIETKTYDFKLPDTLKELRRCELYFTATEASIDVTVEFRSDGYPNWVLWGQCTLPGHQQPCTLDTTNCQSPGCPVEGYWFQYKMPTPPNTCDPNTNKLIRVGFHFQLRITWKGPATLLMVMLHAEELVEDPNGGCCGVPVLSTPPAPIPTPIPPAPPPSTVIIPPSTTYWVTQTGTGDGSSLANAASLAAFNANSTLIAGSSVAFSGTFSGAINPTCSGTTAAPTYLDFRSATLQATTTLASNSYLIICGATTDPASPNDSFSLTNTTGITIDSCTALYTNASAGPSFVSFTGCSSTTISNCTVRNCGYGIFGDRCTGVLIQSCDIANSAGSVINQSDIIHIGSGVNVTIEKCRLVMKAPGSATNQRHNDVIQTFKSGTSGPTVQPQNWVIRYNWIENDNTAAGGSDGNSSLIIMQDMTGQPALQIYGNVLICPPNSGGGVNNGVHCGTMTLATDTYYFIGNTLIKNQNPLLAILFNDANKAAGQGLGTLYCSNNIAWCPLTGASQGSTTNNYAIGKISANDWFNFANAQTGVPTIPPTITTDPLFTNVSANDYSLKTSSPCIGAGDTTVGVTFNTGLVPGCTWPNPALAVRGSSWDMGAYVAIRTVVTSPKS